MATLKDIAKRCDVSVSTVSRVLKNDKSLVVNSETRQIIFSVAKELGYKTKTVNLAGWNIGIVNWYSHDQEVIDPYYYYIRKGVETKLKAYDLSYDFYFKDDEIDPPRKYDGIIAIGKFSQATSEKLKEKAHCVIYVDSNPNPQLYNSVEVDFEEMLGQVFEYTLKNKIKTVGLLSGCEQIGDEVYPDPRNIAFSKLSKLYNIATENYSIAGQFTTESGYEMFYQLHEEKRVPKLLVCGSDMIAIGVNKAAYKLGYKVGTDLLIIGFNNIPIAKYMVPSLSTFSIPMEQMGREAVDLLIKSLKSEDNYVVKVSVPTRFVKRKSAN